jgi:choice-of-anchor B domain-containing protein
LSRKRSSARFPGLLVLLALTLTVGVILAMTATAANPDAGMVNATDAPMTGWDGPTYAVGQTKDPLACNAPDPDNLLCDRFTLDVNIPESHWDDSTGGVEVKIGWEDEADDFDLYVYNAAGEEVGSSAVGGTSSERVFITDANEADGPYEVVVTPWDVTDSPYRGGAWVESRPDSDGGASDAPIPTETVSNAPCTDGTAAGVFPCEDVDLESFVPKEQMGDSGAELNDIWGWTDPATGDEFALVGRTDGTSFVNVSDPQNPVYLGELPSHQSVAGEPVETIFNSWRDIKVYKNHAYIGSEEPSHGLQVFDLTQLSGQTEPPEGGNWEETNHYSFVTDGIASVLEPGDITRPNTLDNSHNIAINEQSGMLSAIGTSTCGSGGPHMIDLSDPANPTFAGCDSEDSYTHDNQCVNYRQSDPDPDHRGKEICFNSNEDTLTIVDVTDPAEPKQLARMEYDGASYTHQAWLTEDRRYILMDDELDEQEGESAGGKTATYVVDVQNLDNPLLVNEHAGEAESIDHNQYVRGDRTFQANYRSGLRILDVSNVAQAGSLTEKGFFDVYPADDQPEFNGMWSNYPYFKSGVVIASGIEQGLFVLRPTNDAPFTPGTEIPDEEAPSQTGDSSTGAAGSAGGQQGASSAPTRKRLGRLRAGFGRHGYGRVRKRSFPVQCRVRGTGTRRCLIKARYTARGKTRTIGSGRGVLRAGRRSTSVRVKLNRAGRRLLARKPRGIPVRLALSAREVSPPKRRATNSRRATLRSKRL